MTFINNNNLSYQNILSRAIYMDHNIKNLNRYQDTVRFHKRNDLNAVTIRSLTLKNSLLQKFLEKAKKYPWMIPPHVEVFDVMEYKHSTTSIRYSNHHGESSVQRDSDPKYVFRLGFTDFEHSPYKQGGHQYHWDNARSATNHYGAGSSLRGVWRSFSMGMTGRARAESEKSYVLMLGTQIIEDYEFRKKLQSRLDKKFGTQNNYWIPGDWGREEYREFMGYARRACFRYMKEHDYRKFRLTDEESGFRAIMWVKPDGEEYLEAGGGGTLSNPTNYNLPVLNWREKSVTVVFNQNRLQREIAKRAMAAEMADKLFQESVREEVGYAVK